ncbi:LodA/GoxA family CTQ-dependent oxidase [Mesorhizobium sp. M0012]|uniref:LodA/GoxA family CTQ-dependent oxidase n=1 Tax=Mesorhizobium sp. M0012 TaxID=2956840 RepID=UPI00333616C9
MLDDAAYCRIHPSIGVARVGNSPSEYFIGPEIPGREPAPVGGFKDRGDPSLGVPPRVKRQGARFRVFAYDRSHKPIGEVTGEHAEIVWVVHLVNSKAEGDRFAGLKGEELPIGERRPREFWRNRDITDRDSLIVDPGPRELHGPNQTAELSSGQFRGLPVPLGEIRTDGLSRLLVLGGFGTSGSSDPAAKIGNYANNDLWHDDVSDGPIKAQVTLRSGKQLSVEPAWVIVAPPDFAPAVQNVVTLYDAILDVAQRERLLGAPPVPSKPSFVKDVGPIFAKLASLQWVQEGARGANGAIAEFSDFERLSDNSEDLEVADFRKAIFARFRNPNLNPESDEAKKQATSEFLPALSGDTGDASPGQPTTWLSVTRSQYDLLTKWRDGKFKNDWKGEWPEPDNEISPEGLDRAALEACAGGAFYPGIEGGWLLRNPTAYTAAFRLSHERLKPGDVTRHMACPWQADFFECAYHWWPAQRPDEVLTQEALRRLREIDERLAQLDPEGREARGLMAERKMLWSERARWARGLPPDSFDGDLAMVAKWHQHGFVVSVDETVKAHVVGDSPAPAESERGKYDGLDWPDYFHILVNIEKYTDFFPKAKELARSFFAGVDYDQDENYLPFEYTPEAFDKRMQKIYDEFVESMNEPSRMDTGIIIYPVKVRRDGDREVKKYVPFEVKPFSNRAVLERLKQRAPFNLTDGAWLQRIQSAGPIDEIRAHLFAIWDDEAGNGRADQNHCNVYETLLRSQNIYMPPIDSRKFVEQGLLPSAFIQPVFQLAVGLFPEEFFPELLGMTLYLEWEATPTLTPNVRSLRQRGIDPHFYSLHVAIDNITAGHGFLAKEAIKLYLQRTELEGGSVSDTWDRIWNGYVTWATAGDLGLDLLVLSMIIDQKQIDISYPMEIVAKTILDAKALLDRLRAAAKEVSDADPLSVLLVSNFRRAAQKRLREDDSGEELIAIVVDELNLVIQSDVSIYDEEVFKTVELSEEVKTLLKQEQKGEELVRLNRLLLRDGYPGLIDTIPKLDPILFPHYRSYFEGRFVDLIKRKSSAAKPMHRGATVNGKNLAELFDTPELLPQALVDGGFVNIEHPRSSRFFELLSFAGPMYKIFTEDEKSVILDWIESLRKAEEPQPAPGPISPQEWAARVLKLIQDNANAASGVARHDSYQLDDANGQPKSLRAWFSDPTGLMAALIRSRWVIPQDSAQSRFYQEFSSGRMSFMGPQVAEMIRQWIESGAVLPTGASSAVATAQVGVFFSETLMAAEAVPMQMGDGATAAESGPPAIPRSPIRPVHRGFAAKRKLIGMGSVH